MSRIIRSQQAQHGEKVAPVEIQIRDIFVPQSFVPNFAKEEQKSAKLSIEEIMAERDRLLAEARSEIAFEQDQFNQFRQQQTEAFEQLKQLWLEEKQQLEQQAYEEGFSAGFEEGIQKAEAQMMESLKTANEITKLAEVNADQYVTEQEALILDVGLKVAEQILGRLIKQDPQNFIDIVQRGLKEAREMSGIKVYVAPEYYALVTQNRNELAEMFPPDVQFLLFVNEDLSETDCYIETNHGRIVVSIDEQLQQLRMKLNEILGSKE